MLTHEIGRFVLYVCKKMIMNNVVVCDTTINDKPLKVKFTLLNENNRQMSESKHSEKYEEVSERIQYYRERIEQVSLLNDALDLDVMGQKDVIARRDLEISHLNKMNHQMGESVDRIISHSNTTIVRLIFWNAVLTAVFLILILFLLFA